MIEVNLISGKKPFKMPVILGVDLSYVNFKAVIFVWLLSLASDYFVQSYFTDQQKVAEEKTTQLRDHTRQLQVKAKSLKKAEEEAQALQEQEKLLQKKLVVVKELIKKKINPMKMLVYISENIPDNVWLSEIVLENSDLTISGFSDSYKGIGIFLDNLKKGIFFKKPIELSKSQTIVDEDTKVRREQFSLKMRVQEY